MSTVQLTINNNSSKASQHLADLGQQLFEYHLIQGQLMHRKGYVEELVCSEKADRR